MFYDRDCSQDPLKGKSIVLSCCGNQERAKALNLVRESPVPQPIRMTWNSLQNSETQPIPRTSPQFLRLLSPNNEDSYTSKAEDDGFGFTTDWSRSGVLAVFIADSKWS